MHACPHLALKQVVATGRHALVGEVLPATQPRDLSSERPLHGMQAAHVDARAQRMVVHELAAERCAELEAELEQQRRAVQALQVPP